MKQSGNTYRKLLLVMMRSKRHLAAICEKYELTPVQGILLIMFDNDTKSMQGISICMGCDASNATGLIDRLDSHGLIERTPGENDRRIKMIKLSAKGLELRQCILDELAKREVVDFDGLTNDEIATFRKVIDRLSTK